MKRFMGIVVMLFMCGCAHTGSSVDTNDPVYKAILGCTAGITSGYKASGNIESDLGKAIKEKKIDLKSEAEVNKFIHGYIFENLPEADREKAYESYLKCYQEQMHSQSSNIIINSPTQIMNDSAGGLQVGGSLIINQKIPDRTLTKEQNETLYGLLSTSSIKCPVSIYSILGDQESFSFAIELSNLLNKADWKSDGVNEGKFGGPQKGLSIDVHDTGIATAECGLLLARALKKIGFQTSGRIVPSVPENELRIVVGSNQ